MFDQSVSYCIFSVLTVSTLVFFFFFWCQQYFSRPRRFTLIYLPTVFISFDKRIVYCR